MSMQQDGAIVVDTLGFRVPCRSFYIRASVTRDRPLPVVDEFVLRLLRVCGQLTLDRLGDFFGFTRAEAERVVRDLVDRDLIVAEGNELRLSADAIALFRASADQEPRMIQIEPRTENVWIDLVSRAFVPRPRTRAYRNLIDVAPTADAANLPADFARAAFEQNFRDYVGRILQWRDPDRVSIHSIAGVEPDRYGSFVIPGRKVISANERSPRLEFEGAADGSLQYRQLIQSLSTEYGKLEQPRAQATSIVEFERLSGVHLKPFLDQNQDFDVARWLADRPKFEDASRSWVIGASYLEANVNAVIERLKGVRPELIKPEVRWLRPAGNSWGMSGDLSAAVESLRRAVSLPDTPRAKGATLLMPRAVRRTSQKTLKRLFERGEEVPPKLGSSLELLIVGRAVAVLLVHVLVHRHETVPVGIITDHPKLVARLHAQLKGENTEAWFSPGRSADAAETAPSPSRTVDVIEE